MPSDGANLPEFRSVQLDFAAHIRNPKINPRPHDIEPRRMQVYVDLFFRNIESFLASAFPVCKKILEHRWPLLVREFLHVHPSESPYFLQISEEFLTYLSHRGLRGLPPFLLELAHYEWVELSLDVADAQTEAFDPGGELSGELVVTPFMRALTYEFPVHQIGVDHQPAGKPELPTYLIVYRNAELKVRFIESNALTHRLLKLLESHTVADALRMICDEVAVSGRVITEAQVQQQGLQILSRLHEQGIILGNRIEGSGKI
jgi:hypothetical protein